MPGHGAAAALGAHLDEQLARAVFAEDAQRLPVRVERVQLDAQRAEALGAELGEDAGPLEQQLDAVPREVAEEARRA